MNKHTDNTNNAVQRLEQRQCDWLPFASNMAPYFPMCAQENCSLYSST